MFVTSTTILASLARSGMMAALAYALGRGWIGQADIPTLAAALTSIATVGYGSIVRNLPGNIAASALSLPDVGAIRMTDGKLVTTPSDAKTLVTGASPDL